MLEALAFQNPGLYNKHAYPLMQQKQKLGLFKIEKQDAFKLGGKINQKTPQETDKFPLASQRGRKVKD